MRNRIFPILFSLFLAGTAGAQQGSRIGQHEGIASWRSVETAPAASFNSAAEGRQMIQEIIDVLGLKANFEIMPANIENAAAVVYGGKRYVLYNPTFINRLVQAAGNKWAAVSVLAHEVGHHLNGHTITRGGSSPDVELEADEFSGFVLRKMGASLKDAQAAMSLLASQTASRTHPARYDRLTSIAKGWDHADDQLAGRSSVAKSAPSTPAPRTQEPVRRSEPVASAPARTTPATAASIIGSVRFSADPNTRYYVTSQYQLVRVSGNGATVIGRLSKVNSRNYPYVIHDAETQLLVDARGSILTREGRRVGVLSAYNA
ncbi:MAG TPA: hypothetical protein VHK69_22525 [Chitinophagaceae bacterium]|jgi:ribosomal protein S19|nr:hypothetical protein [Chitinophagaceae bacterium]